MVLEHTAGGEIAGRNGNQECVTLQYTKRFPGRVVMRTAMPGRYAILERTRKQVAQVESNRLQNGAGVTTGETVN